MTHKPNPMSRENPFFNLGRLRNHRKWNYTYFPFHDYGDRFDGMTMQPKISISKIALSSNISETVSSDALSREFVPPNEVLESTSNKPSLIAVLVIMSVFLLITISTTSLLLAFCRKKNTVFALQKCEEEDSEYELDDIENTDIEMLKEEVNRTHSIKSRSSTCPSFSQIHRESHDLKDSPTNEPLMPNSSAKLIIKSNYHKNDKLRMSKSKTFSVYYNAKIDDQTIVCNNVLQMQSLHDDGDLESRNLYKDYLLERTILQNACYTDDQTTACDNVLQMESFHDDCDQESRNIYQEYGLESSILHNACCSDSKKNVRKQNNPKEDYILDSSILQKTGCYTNTADFKLQIQENLPTDTSCMTTNVNNENAKFTDNDQGKNLEDSILVEVCSGHCINYLDNSVMTTADVNVKSKGDNCLVDTTVDDRQNYLDNRITNNTDSSVKSGHSQLNTRDSFQRNSDHLCSEYRAVNDLENCTVNTTDFGEKRNSDVETSNRATCKKISDVSEMQW